MKQPFSRCPICKAVNQRKQFEKTKTASDLSMFRILAQRAVDTLKTPNVLQRFTCEHALDRNLAISELKLLATQHDTPQGRVNISRMRLFWTLR